MFESHAVLVALHPEATEVLLARGADGEEHLSLAFGNTVLAPTSSSYHLPNRVGDPLLLVVVGTHAPGRGYRGAGARAARQCGAGGHGQRHIERRSVVSCRSGY